MKRIGRYEIVSELGRGAMGIVYRANDPVIGRTVAIKTIRLGDITDPQEHQRLRDRLFREARSAGILSHPNIVTVYDIGEEGDMAYIAMEFVNGYTLEVPMRGEGVEKHVILSVLYETAAALDYAHQKGIVHRDIKPANIMINENGAVKIADFGVAKILSQQVTQADLVLGTPSYMSPEQIEAKSLDGRSDQFAMAVITYEMLTGEKPFAGDTLPSLLFKIVKEEALPPHNLNPTLTQKTTEVIARAMSKPSAQRYSTCAEFVQALTDSLSASPAWRPLARGAASTMATIAETLPEVQHAEPTVGRPVAAAPPPPPPPPAAARAVPSERTVPPAESAPPPPEPAVPAPPAAEPPPTPRVRRQAEEPARTSGAGRYIGVGVAVVALAGMGYFGFTQFSSPPPAGGNSVVSDPAPPPDPPAPVDPGALPAPVPKPEPPPPKTDAVVPPVATPAPSRPPAATVAPKGSLVEIDSQPSGAKVSIDQGEFACTTPCPIELPPGRHVMELTLAGHRKALRIFNSPQDSRMSIKLDPEMGMLAIKSTPEDAQILLNGQPQAKRTPALLSLPAGRYKIVLRKQGFRDYEEEVEVRDNVTRTIEVSWAPGGGAAP